MRGQEINIDRNIYNFWYPDQRRAQLLSPAWIAPDQTIWYPVYFLPVEITPGVTVFQQYYLAYALDPIRHAGVTQFAAPRPRHVPINIRRLEDLAEDF